MFGNTQVAMRQKISVIMFDWNGKSAKEVVFSKTHLWVAGGLVLITLCTSIIFGLHYYRLKRSLPHNHRLHAETTYQTDKIALQRRQLHILTGHIERLKLKVNDLQRFKQDIRATAGMGGADRSSSLIGVGGAKNFGSSLEDKKGPDKYQFKAKTSLKAQTIRNKIKIYESQKRLPE